MFAPNRRIGVAVSGGADSVCLLHLLRLLPVPLHLHILHVNHRLRGPASDEDARFVAQLAAQLGLPFHSDSTFQPAPGNLEQSARHHRLAFFHAIKDAHGLQKIATGHTQSDQAETVLFRFLRGAGPTGLRGILPTTSSGLIRPLLCLTRDETRAFLTARNLPWREDASNSDPRFTRNRLRHELLPHLTSVYNPQLPSSLAHAALLHHDEQDYFDRTLAPIAARILLPAPGGIQFHAHELAALHPALQRRLLRLAIAQVHTLDGIDFPHIEHALATALGHPPARRSLPGLTITRSMEWVCLAKSPAPAPATTPIPLHPPCRIPLPTGNTLLLDLLASDSPQCRYNEDQAAHTSWDLLDWDKIAAPLHLRFFQPGDRYHPATAPHSRKLKELFQLARIPSWDRPLWPMIESSQGILWSRQFGPCAAVLPGPLSRRLLAIAEFPGYLESNTPAVASV